MTRVVAFEGPDLCGKTTLLSKIREREPYCWWPQFTMTVSKRMLWQGGDALSSAVKEFNAGLVFMSSKTSMLLDRCYLTHYVYRKAFSQPYDAMWLRDVASVLRPVIVYVKTPWDVVEARYHERGDSNWDIEDVFAVYQEYERWFVENPFRDTVVVASGVAPDEDTRLVKVLEAYL